MKLNRAFRLFLLVSVLIAALPNFVLAAPKRPTTTAELALYNEADRQQILEEGAKKEGKPYI